MPRTRSLLPPALGGLLLLLGACAGGGGSAAAPLPGEYAALADTLVCVVDRTTASGLRDLLAKRTAQGAVLVHVDGQVRTLEEVHPVSLLAGYAGNEGWLQRGEPVTLGTARYLPYQGQRRIPIGQLTRVGDHQAIPLYAAREERAPHATLYVPTRPGCIFQPYVRSDLLRR